MKIGDLAEWAQCPTVTIRYYEKIGLLSGEKRDHLNHRVYGKEDMARLRFIMRCRNHRISMADIRTLLDLRDGLGNGDSNAAKIIRRQIEKLEAQKQSLEQLIKSLSSLLSSSCAYDPCGGGIIKALESPCPHCVDYEDRIQDGSKIDKRAECLASPRLRKGHDTF